MMYARFLSARHGRAAGRYARKNGDRLLARGDIPGHIIWNRVADTIEGTAAQPALAVDVIGQS
jgi:hypothetical protein